MLHIYNSLTRAKEPLKPIHPGKVGLYACGMTVYDYCHIGHARVMVVFDMVSRYLRSQNYQVTYVRNITDIDDKIINRARENKEEITALTERFIKAMHEDERTLGVLPPDYQPRATEYIPQMIALIQKLIDQDYAYVAKNGDVYYRVNRFAHYGELAHQDLENLRAGARVEVLDAKQDPLDFVLWKLAKPGEPTWDSPWGNGRPGWHIECSVMSTELLGRHFDIHGGGLDLIFPHHENEIAQSEGAYQEKFVDMWMHVGYVQVNMEKMSKSLGNFFIIRDVLANFNAEVVRYFLLASHYRSPINYSTENLNSAGEALERFYTCLRGLPEAVEMTNEKYIQQFNAAMNDDFNVPVALASLFDLTREINRLRDEGNIDHAAGLAALLKRLGGILGLLQQSPEEFLQAGINHEEARQIESLIEGRNEARRQKNWAQADKLRDQLLEMGVALEDGSKGTIWRKK